MTHIHRTHGHPKPHLSTGQLKPAEAPSGGAAPKAKAASMKADQNEVHFKDAAARAKAQKSAVASHWGSNIQNLDKAFQTASFKADRRERARIPATPLHPPAVMKVVADGGTVRTHPMGLVTGNLKKGDHFIAEATKTDGKGNTWAWGRAQGKADKPGWMMMKGGPTQVLHKTDQHVPKGYKSVGEATNMAKLWKLKYVNGKDKLKHGKDYTLRFTVKPGHEVKMFANYTPGQKPTGNMQTLKPGDVVRLRYSLDGKVAMAQRKSKDDVDAHSKWGYVKMDDVRYTPLKEKTH
jgi:hypothetical protein